MFLPTLLYAGGDELVLRGLEEYCASANYRFAIVGQHHIERTMIFDREQILILDFDGLEEPLVVLAQLKDSDKALPLIVLSSVVPEALTLLSVARMDGAEAFHWKPIHNWSNVAASIDATVARMQRWHESLQGVVQQPC